jgi:hypothetical protein
MAKYGGGKWARSDRQKRKVEETEMINLRLE